MKYTLQAWRKKHNLNLRETSNLIGFVERHLFNLDARPIGKRLAVLLRYYDYMLSKTFKDASELLREDYRKFHDHE